MTNKKKTYLLFAGFIILIWLSWSFGISKTLSAYSESSKLKVRLAEINSRPVSLGQMKKQIFVLDSIIDEQNLKEGSFHQRLLHSIEDISSKEKISIIDYNQPHVFQKGNHNIQTAMITLKGSYTSLIRYIHYIEQEVHLGSVFSVTFDKVENRV